MVRCGKCKREGHNRLTCHRYLPVVPLPEPLPREPVPLSIVLPQPRPLPYVPDIPVQKAKLNKELKKRIIRRHEAIIGRILRQFDIQDPNDIARNELSNKYLQEEFEHQNGLVNISDMKTVMTTKYISRLFGNNNVKDDISCQINEYLESFDGDDGFDDW